MIASASETVVMAFLVLSLFAYVLCGGADFGVGILELTSSRFRSSRSVEERRALRKAGERAIAPVWEANHIWIIVALVILFVAFPEVHVHMATQLHIPLLLMLVGIILRGTAFVFRYYDVGDDPSVHRLWTVLFCGGSALVPFMFGHLAAAMSRGGLSSTAIFTSEDSTLPPSVYEAYVAPWVGVFPAVTGLFVIALFAWLAAVFLVGELSGPQQTQASARAKRWTLVVIVLGGAVTGAAWLEGVPWFVEATKDFTVYGAFLVATSGMAFLWRLLSTNKTWTTRVVAGGVVGAVLAGYWGAVYPVALELQGGAQRTWHDAAAPAATMTALAATLLIAGALVIPGLTWLYRLFKSSPAH